MSAAQLWLKHRAVAHSIADEFFIPGLGHDDVDQEALIALWVASRSFNPDMGASFKTWGGRVVRARLTDLLRRATREKRGRFVRLTPDHEQAAPDPGGQVRELLELLPDLTDIEKGAIAAKLNGTYRAADRRQENALQRVKKKLAA
jgi:RNA polymerase sigma factor (sigma-70 family)